MAFICDYGHRHRTETAVDQWGRNPQMTTNQSVITRLIDIQRRIDQVCFNTSISDQRRKTLDEINAEITTVIDELRNDYHGN